MAGGPALWARRASVPLASLIAAGVLLAGLDRALPPPPMPEVSALVTDREGRALRAFPVEDGRWRLPVDPEAVDPAFRAALIEIEDQRFYSHHGVDPLAMARAAGSLVSTGRIVSGGSTITMQTARLLEPRPRRTMGAQLLEMVRAIQLEWRYSKAEILQALSVQTVPPTLQKSPHRCAAPFRRLPGTRRSILPARAVRCVLRSISGFRLRWRAVLPSWPRMPGRMCRLPPLSSRWTGGKCGQPWDLPGVTVRAAGLI
jgi:hypothetical protein